jgi:DNA-binding transcriptional MerR regulator
VTVPVHREDNCMITAFQLADDTDLTYRQIDFWSRVGYLRPTTRKREPNQDRKSGRERVYPPTEATVAARMAKLVKAGLTVHTAHDVARGDPTTITTLLHAIKESAPHLPPPIDHARENQ